MAKLSSSTKVTKSAMFADCVREAIVDCLSSEENSSIFRDIVTEDLGGMRVSKLVDKQQFIQKVVTLALSDSNGALKDVLTSLVGECLEILEEGED